MKKNNQSFHIVIIGGGFGGLYAAKGLMRSNLSVTLIDKRNFHLFQPLLYQIAAGELSPGDIAAPLRSIFHRHKKIRVLMDEVVDLDPVAHEVVLKDSRLHYDALVVATGASPFYFGNEQWARLAPPLKTVENAVAIRHRILKSFEQAEVETDPQKKQALLTFAIIGGGPTGVELAGAIGELARTTLKHDFQSINPLDARILLIEAGPRILNAFPDKLSDKAVKSLNKLGVSIMTKTSVVDISRDAVAIQKDQLPATVASRNVFWTAGVRASGFGRIMADRCQVELDRSGRVPVQEHLNLSEFPEIFVIGDQACINGRDGRPLPGLAVVAMQQGRYVAKCLKQQSRGMPLRRGFRYVSYGTLAVIGRNEAVADFKRFHFSGRLAWYVWTMIHIRYLIGFGSKVAVMLLWAWNYITNQRNARLITGKDISE